MEKVKTILDRKQLSSEHIRSKQDFANVVNCAKGLGKPYWQTNWFYGTVGVATVAIIVTAVTLSSSDTTDENPDKNNVVAMAATDDREKEPVIEDNSESKDNQEVDSNIEDTPEASNEENNSQPTSPDDTPSDTQNQNSVNETANNSAARTAPVNEETEKMTEVGLPNVAGVSGGPIAFRDFCDPMGDRKSVV